MAFLAGVQTVLGSVNEHCLVMWHSHSLPVTPKRFLLLQKASGEIAEAGFVAEMRTKGFSHFRQSSQFSSQFHKERRGGDLCRKKPSVWWFGFSEGRKKSLSLFVPAMGRVQGTSSPVSETIASLADSCKQLQYFQLYVKHNGYSLSQWILSCWDKWHGLLESCPKNW